MDADLDEKIAARLERAQAQRFRLAPDKIKFFQSAHEIHITRKIQMHRRLSDTYDPDAKK